jgi:hypothetical protein
MNHKIDLDEFVLQVEITDLTNTPPDPTSWDSPDDFYGCREVEFSVVSGVIYDDDGTPTDLSASACKALGEQYAELIEDRLWTIVDDAADNAALERAEARAARYAA